MRQPNPAEDINFWSKITFCYALKILRKGLNKEFTEDDVYETLHEHKCEVLGDSIEKLWRSEELKSLKLKKSISLQRTVMKMFLKDFILIGLALGLLSLVIRPMQAITLGHLTKRLTNSTKDISGVVTEATVFTSCTLLSVVIFHPSTMGLMNIGLKVKIACSSLIYRKTLRLNQRAFQHTSIGHIINLLSSDVNVFDKYISTSHYIWIGPLQTLLYSYIMYRSVGLSSLFGMAFLLFFIPLYFILGHYISKTRIKASLKRDQRLKLTAEVIKGINTIKMQTWEKMFSQLVSENRKFELRYVRLSLYLKGLLHLQTIFTTVPLFITILIHVLLNNKIDAEKLFLLINLYNNIGYTMATLFPQGIIAMREAFVSFGRIKEFLQFEEVIQYTRAYDELATVSLENVAVNHVLKDINIIFPKEKLSVIVGPVGSGKSTLLRSILNEASSITGNVVVNGVISYSSQEPWVFSGTIQENILFGSVVDETRYKIIVKICALDTDFAILHYGDQTYIGERGVALSGGQKSRVSLARALYKEADIYLLDDPLSAVDINVGKKIFHECFQQFLEGKTIILVTHQMQFLHNVDNIIVLCNGKACTDSQFNNENLLSDDVDFITETKLDKPLIVKEKTKIDMETRTSGPVSWSVYKYYILACHSYYFIGLTILFFTLSQVSVSATSYFTKYWINLEEDCLKTPQNTFLLIYFALTLLSVILSILRMITLYSTCTRSSQNLHATLFANLLQTKTSFFTVNSSGQILNRFSKDMNVVDEYLPSTIFVILQYAFSLTGSVVLIATVKPWTIIPGAIIGILFYFLNSQYLSASISLKRLEGITKSPILEHLIGLFQGLPTIRSFKKQDFVRKVFNSHQDLYSCTYHITLSTSRAFGFWLDILCVCYIAIITYTVVLSNDEKYGGNIGLLLTQALQLLGHFQLATKQCAEIENHMTSVERLREYHFIDREECKETSSVDWPEKGRIQFQSVYLKYQLSASYVLKNISFTIEPHEKVGIVGRTGSGKSSLVSALFQLIDIEGLITIDEVNIKDIDLKSLRSKLSIIPQNPLLFSSTIRKNLDVFEQHSDEALWKTLEEVNLKQAFNNINLDLDSNVREDGCNLSLGQKQLICLARAILSKRKILILDESTASVDVETEATVQKIVKEKFIDCTVLTVAHRLLTVIDSDKILVMDDGKVVEFDHPYLLLQKRNGVFSNMVHQTNANMSKTLRKLAENAYKNK